MGLRSLLGSIRRKKPEPEDESTPEPQKKKETPIAAPPVVKDPVKEDKSPKATQRTIDQAKAPAPSPVVRKAPLPPVRTLPPVRMGEDPNTKEVNVRNVDRDESPQERINRVKSGKMTEKEKAAFLASALTAGTTSESRKPLRGKDESRGYKRGIASPFPTDSILRNFARGQKAGAARSVRDDFPEKKGLDTDKKKRDYLDMVTNPDRFQRYKASTPSSGGGLSRISGSVGGDRKTYIPDIADLDLAEPKPEIRQQSPVPVPTDLGARLGAAAIVNETLRKQQEEQRRKLSKQLEEQRREQMRQHTELERQRQEELNLREAQVKDKKRQEEESIARERDEKKLVELKRLEELMKAQEDYWTQKLATERASKPKVEVEVTEPLYEAELFQALVEPDLEPSDGIVLEQEEPALEPWDEIVLEQEEPALEPSDEYFAGPNESNLLELAEHDREEDWEHNKEIIERKAAEITGRAPALNTVPTEKSFLQEQAEFKAEVDRKRSEQLQRLKALNSPLPSPRVAAPPSTLPLSRRPAPTSTPARSLGNMLKSINEKGSVKKDDNSAGLSARVQAAPQKRSEPEDPRLSISELTRRKNAKATPAKLQPPRRDPPKERTGPIRMQLPLGDEDDEDFDASSNKSMSISEAMKNAKADKTGSSQSQKDQSKKWGIDMSRFLD
jgi:hypothetical protein